MAKITDREQLINAIIDLGQRLHGDGFGPSIEHWREYRDRATLPNERRVYEAIMGVAIVDRRHIVREEWQAMLEVIGLRWPPVIWDTPNRRRVREDNIPVKRYKLAEHGKKDRTIQRIRVDSVNAFGWTVREVYYPHLNRSKRVWVAMLY